MSAKINRQAAARAALLSPATVQIGEFTVRALSGGDVLIGEDMDLAFTSGDQARVLAMPFKQQKREILILGALLCHPVEVIKDALWVLPAAEIIRKFVAPVLMRLSLEDQARLVDHVSKFIGLAAAAVVDVETKPREGEGPEPSGK